MIWKIPDQGAEIIGLNSRNLHTLEIDEDLAAALIKHIPKDRIVVAESGDQDPPRLFKIPKVKG